MRVLGTNSDIVVVGGAMGALLTFYTTCYVTKVQQVGSPFARVMDAFEHVVARREAELLAAAGGHDSLDAAARLEESRGRRLVLSMAAASSSTVLTAAPLAAFMLQRGTVAYVSHEFGPLKIAALLAWLLGGVVEGQLQRDRSGGHVLVRNDEDYRSRPTALEHFTAWELTELYTKVPRRSPSSARAASADDGPAADELDDDDDAAMHDVFDQMDRADRAAAADHGDDGRPALDAAAGADVGRRPQASRMRHTSLTRTVLEGVADQILYVSGSGRVYRVGECRSRCSRATHKRPRTSCACARTPSLSSPVATRRRTVPTSSRRSPQWSSTRRRQPMGTRC
jgi:hypothetical protein